MHAFTACSRRSINASIHINCLPLATLSSFGRRHAPINRYILLLHEGSSRTCNILASVSYAGGVFGFLAPRGLCTYARCPILHPFPQSGQHAPQPHQPQPNLDQSALFWILLSTSTNIHLTHTSPHINIHHHLHSFCDCATLPDVSCCLPYASVSTLQSLHSRNSTDIHHRVLAPTLKTCGGASRPPRRPRVARCARPTAATQRAQEQAALHDAIAAAPSGDTAQCEWL